MSFERDKGCHCIPIGCKNSVLANSNTETPLVPLKREYVTALFPQIIRSCGNLSGRESRYIEKILNPQKSVCERISICGCRANTGSLKAKAKVFGLVHHEMGIYFYHEINFSYQA